MKIRRANPFHVAIIVAVLLVRKFFRAMYEKRRAELDDIDETSEG